MFAERNKTICNKTFNKCIVNVYFSYFVTLIINIESAFLFVGYMNGFCRDRFSNTCSYLHCAFYIYGSKVGAHYRSTLFADLNLEITLHVLLSLSRQWPFMYPTYKTDSILIIKVKNMNKNMH